MKIRGIEIKKGARISLTNSIYWEVISLRPFLVVNHQLGESWFINVSPSKWAEKIKSHKT